MPKLMGLTRTQIAARKAQPRKLKAQKTAQELKDAPSRGHSGFSPEAPDDVLDERERRMVADARRDVTSRFFGDPPPGFSALDRRR